MYIHPWTVYKNEIRKKIFRGFFMVLIFACNIPYTTKDLRARTINQKIYKTMNHKKKGYKPRNHEQERK